MDKASAYGAGDCRFESCRGHFCVNMQQHGLTSITHQSSCGMMFASVRHAELEHEYTCNQVTCISGGLGSAVALGSASTLALHSALALEISALVLSIWEVLVGLVMLVALALL